MQLHALLGAIGLCAVVGSFALAHSATTVTPASSPKAPKYGHLILQLEGNVTALNVTWITPKRSGYNRTKHQGKFAVDLLDANGGQIGTYPIDLSRFDRNPGNIGKRIRVEGCEVLDTRIVTIVNVPWSEKLASLRIRHGNKVIGGLDAASTVKLVEQGAVR